ncbi:hypothetical protein I4U23_020448 [Adineta vaga]|nr:hypothetical protein I4U23_020448 [Adineta vaga]
MIKTVVIFFSLLLSTIIQSQDIAVNFPTFPINTDIGSCTCDLTASACDASCCCDPDCTTDDISVFGCSSRENQYTNTTPILSTVQPTCFKNLSIFYSNSPYIIQKMGELVCIDYSRYSGSQYYQQPNIETLNAADFVRTFNAENSVTVPLGIPTGLTNYQVGTPVLVYRNGTGVMVYTLRVGVFNSPVCLGSQSITYMNDFTSTCSQIVTTSSCTSDLDISTYLNSLCFIRSPANPFDSTTYICNIATTTTIPTSSVSGSSCINALQSLTVTIYYANPTGIVSVAMTGTTANATVTALFTQTFTVQFVKNGSSISSTTRNPGYIAGAYLVSGISNGTVITVSSSSQFSVIKSASTGFCNSNARIPIRFGENIQSTCKISSTCPSASDLFVPLSSDSVYVAAYSNSDPFNVSSDWLPVISCTSQIGNPTARQCQNGVLNSSSTSSCYYRLDIQIVYTNIGSLINPQTVLSAVIFHYQYSSAATTTPQILTQTVTFQDISAASIVIQGRIPAPNTRLPASFFYPFSVSEATKSPTFTSFSLVIICILCIFI